MDGRIHKTKSSVINNIVLTISGGGLALLMTCILIGGRDELTSADIGACIIIIILGCIGVILGGIFLYIRKNAYIHVEEDTISAYCHLGGRLNCRMEDIEYIRQYRMHGGTALEIHLLNGKKYEIDNLENADAIDKYIKRRMPHKESTNEAAGDLVQLHAEKQILRKTNKRILILWLCGFSALILLIILSFVLTGGRELHEFSQQDWYIFSVICGISAVLVIISIILFVRLIRTSKMMEKKEAEIWRALLMTAPLRPGKALRMFLDSSDYPSYRLVIYGLPGYTEIYYVTESVRSDEEIVLVSQSKLQPDFEALKPELVGMTEVPLPTGENAGT